MVQVGFKGKTKISFKSCLFSHYLRNQMAPTFDHQLTYEKTPSYFAFQGVPKRVFDFNPKIKLIVIIRDPVIRAVSQFVQYTIRNRFIINKNKTFNATVEFKMKVLEPNGTVVHRDYDTMIAPGRYVDHYKRWLKYFPKEQILVCDGDNFIRNPYEEMLKVEKFLNLKPFYQKEHFFYDNNKGFFCLNKDLNNTKIECMKENKGQPHPPVSDDVIEKLKEYYEPYNQELFDMLGVERFW
jgi:hypothetical protein